MSSFDLFLVDMWRLKHVTGMSRYDVEVTLPERDEHLESCPGATLTRTSMQQRRSKVLIKATVSCRHGNEVRVQFKLNDDVWMLKGLIPLGCAEETESVTG